MAENQFKTSFYFLGSQTPQGFKTHFDRIIADRKMYSYIIKGGPGTGKSSLMKKIAEAFKDKSDIDLYYCSSDPDSLDAVVIKAKNVLICDGTAPHIFDPVYPGARQKIINMGDYWDEQSLKENAEGIIISTDENKLLHMRVKRYIGALTELFSDTYRIGEQCLNAQKLDGFTARFAKKLFSKVKGEKKAVSYSQLSALTQKGYITQTETLKDYTVYAIEDSYFCASDRFLKSIVSAALLKDLSVIISECRLLPECSYEHILLPELKLAFCSSNSMNGLEIQNSVKMNFSRFYDKTIVAEKRARLNFNKKAANDLIDEAAKTLTRAKAVHDDIEKYYVGAMNFDKAKEVEKAIIDEISKI